ncbi:MAG: cytochrome c [Bdellovibrionales bacterium]|nr:cytochrome c [Bdellovibrionales bacterium]
MATTPALKAQRGYSGFEGGSSELVPPEGTLPRGFTRYTIAYAEDADAKLKNPLPRTAAVLARGKDRYGVFCAVCHGDKGLGDGPVINPYPIPKSLQSDQMMKWGDGHIFHVITRGQGVMPSYARQIPVTDRWAIIHYLRALQRAEHPTEEDLRAYEKAQQN